MHGFVVVGYLLLSRWIKKLIW